MKKFWHIFTICMLMLAMLVVFVSCGESCGGDDPVDTHEPDDEPTVFEVVFVAGDGTVLKTDTVELGGAATAPEVPARTGFEFTGWDIEFDNVEADLTVTAQYIRVWTVNFVDLDGEVLKTETVRDGGAATAPSNPTQAKYEFTGWDIAYDKVTSDLTVTAQYVRLWTVTFVDHDGSELKSETVRDAGAATAPADPTRAGHIFTGWDVAYDTITADLTVTAQYVPAWTVTFLDYDGTVLSVQPVRDGGAATAPADPAREHFDFLGWDKEFDVVTADLIVTAEYEEHPRFTVTFKDHDGSVITEVSVYRGEAATAPDAPTHVGFVFVKWDKTFDNITEATVVTAECIASYTVTFVDYDGTTLKEQQVAEGQDATAPAPPPRTGYIFTGWDKAFTGVTSHLTVTAQYEIIKYNVQFNTQTDAKIDTQVVEHGSLALQPEDPVRDGFDFVEWQLDGKSYDFATPVTADITLIAVYKSNGTVPTPTNTTALIDPQRLEVWTDMSLRLHVKPGSSNAGMNFVDGSNATFEFVSTDSTILTVADDGTFTTYDKVGTVEVYAIAKTGGTLTYNGDDYIIAKGDIIPSTTIKVVEQPEYYQRAQTEDDQQITLGATETSRIDKNDYLSYPTGAYGDANISLWYNGTEAVFTMTVDDNPNAAQQSGKWEEWRQLYNIPVTFIVWSDNCYATEGTIWRQLNEMGNAVQPHGANHLKIDETVSSARAWYDFYYGQQQISSAIGEQALIIGYANGTNNAALSSMLFIGGRGTYGSVNSVETIDYNMTNSFSGFISSFGTKVDSVLNGSELGGWISVHYHSYGGNAAGEATVKGNYDILKPYIDNGRLWAATFAAAAQYGQERDTASLQVTEAGTDVIKFTVTDMMSDILYDHPLSIRIKVDSTWKNARASQNGVEVAARVIEHNGETYLMVDAVPDRGEVTVVRTDLGTINQTEDSISFTPVDAVGTQNAMPMTYGFAVTGDAWKYAYATQDGNCIPASVETVSGVTYVYVTFKANGGTVNVVPLTNQYDALDSYTMTMIHSGAVAPDVNKPITVSTSAELVMLSEYVNEGNTLSGVTVRLTDDIDMSGIDFVPIGFIAFYTSSSGFDRYVPFSGIFDGTGYTISNLTVDRTDGQGGLFGYAKGATICDLTIEGNVAAPARVGGIAGYIEDTGITKCTYRGTVSGVGIIYNNNTASYVGGLVGYMQSGTVEHCSFIGDITAYGAYTDGGTSANYVGGFVGQIILGTINNCYIEGNVTAYGFGTTGAKYVGGMLGNTSGVESGNKILTNCTAKVNVTGSVYVGGIVGSFNSSSSYRPVQIYNNSVSGTVNGDDYVGGLAGEVTGFGGARMANCYANVKVNASAEAVYIGTIAGGYTAESYGAKINDNYYVGSLNPGMPLFTQINNKGEATGVDVTDVDAALTALNTYASANAYFPWRLVDGLPTATYEDVCTVVFVGYGGEILKTQVVVKGMDAVAPEVPVVSGYEFTGWDKTFTAITGDTTVTALYQQVIVHTVVFKGQNGTEVLDTQEINDGLAATAPEAPVIEGYRFTGWDVAFDNVTSDLTVTAQYIKTWVITYLKKDGSVYRTDVVDDGTTPTVPMGAIELGYIFQSWDKTLGAITEDVTLTPIYTVRSETAATDIKVMQWTLGGNAIYLSNFKTKFNDAVTAADPDVVIITGLTSGAINNTRYFGLDGYTSWVYSGGTGEESFRHFGEGFAIFYKTDKFDKAGEVMWGKPSFQKSGYVVYPLATKDGLIVPVVCAAFTAKSAKTDAAALFTDLTAKLGDALDCAIIGVQIAGSTVDAVTGWQSYLTTEADASGKVFISNAGTLVTKDGETDQNANYLVTYGATNPTITAGTAEILAMTEDTTVYPNRQNVHGGFLCKAVTQTVSIGATTPDE